MYMIKNVALLLALLPLKRLAIVEIPRSMFQWETNAQHAALPVSRVQTQPEACRVLIGGSHFFSSAAGLGFAQNDAVQFA